MSNSMLNTRHAYGKAGSSSYENSLLVPDQDIDDDLDSDREVVHVNVEANVRSMNGRVATSSRSSTPSIIQPHSSTPPTVENWEDAYDNERWGRFIISCVAIVLPAIVNPLMVSILNDIAPRHALPDLTFSLIDEQPWARVTSDILVTTAGCIIVLVCMLHRYRVVVLRRTLLLASVAYMLRVACLICTQLPVGFSNSTIYCQPAVADPNVLTILDRWWKKFFAFGTSTATGDLCGDMFYSGHTIVFTMCYLTCRTYLPRSLAWCRWPIAPMCLFGALALILSRVHYTVDVVVGYWMSVGLYTLYHSVCEMPHSTRRQSIARHLWLIRFVHWFEKPVPAGRIPNRMNWFLGARFPPRLDAWLRRLSDPTPFCDDPNLYNALAANGRTSRQSSTSTADDDSTLTNPLLSEEGRISNNQKRRIR